MCYTDVYCWGFTLQHPLKYLFPLLLFLQKSAVASVTHYQRWVLMGGCFAWQAWCTVDACDVSPSSETYPYTHINTFVPF